MNKCENCGCYSEKIRTYFFPDGSCADLCPSCTKLEDETTKKIEEAEYKRMRDEYGYEFYP